MKVAHLDNEVAGKGTIKELLETARGYEKDGENDKAIKSYLAIIKKKPLQEIAYNRLMILYRKLREYQKEIAVIDQAIDAFESGSNSGKKNNESRKQADRMIGKLSLSLGKVTGLIDKKGKSLYDPEPVASWRKRKQLSQKRLKIKNK